MMTYIIISVLLLVAELLYFKMAKNTPFLTLYGTVCSLRSEGTGNGHLPQAT